MNSKRILLVDDEVALTNSLSRLLEVRGYEVKAVDNGKDALRALGEAAFDAVVLDLKMPGMYGYEVIRHLKGDEATRGIPIIVITASPVDKERDRVRVLGMGVTQYMTKPLSIETIVAEIKKATMER